MTCNSKLAKPIGEDAYVFALQNAGTVITVTGTNSLKVHLKLSNAHCYTDMKFIDGLDILAVATIERMYLFDLHKKKQLAEVNVNDTLQLECENSRVIDIGCTQTRKLSITYRRQ